MALGIQTMISKFLFSLAIMIVASSVISPALSRAATVPEFCEANTKSSGLSKEDCIAIFSNTPYYSQEDTEVDCTTGISLNGLDNGALAFGYFIKQGLTPEQSAGIVGNLVVESGLDPTIKQIGGGAGRGIAQWDYRDRWLVLFQFAEARGLDGFDINTQLQFIWFEMTNTPEAPGVRGGTEARAYEHLLSTTTLEEATESFGTKYERAGILALERRIQAARSAIVEYGELAGVDIQKASCAGSVSYNAEGFYFPLSVTKSELQKGTDSGGTTLVWCAERKTNCHHNYNAADIFVERGTPVLAAKAGTVIRAVEQRGSVGSRVVVRGDDNFIYYYAHMDLNSLTVKKNDKVIGGQKIGEVGDNTQAVGTARHLHFDVLPPPHTSRVSCAGAACKSVKPPFVLVQPILSELYEGLAP